MTLTMDQKVKIVNSVTDENLFRKEVLIPIFHNKQKFLHVIDNHGIDEKGSDIVLIEQGEYGQFIYTSVIVKSKKINRAATGSSTAATVMNQMEMASIAGFHCPIQKRDVRFDWLMIATSQDISNEAQDLLNKKGIALHTSPIFLFGERLIEQIDSYLPDFYFYTSAQYSQLATVMRRKCEKLYELQKIARYTGEVREILEVYVTPRFRHTILEAKKKEPKRVSQNIYEPLPGILDRHSRILIVGGPGSGKSTTIREALLKLQSNNTRNKRPTIPLLVRAVDVAAQGKDDFVTAFNQVIQHETELSEFDLAELEPNADIYIFIDGLDELVEQMKREKFAVALDNFEQTYKNVNIIVTSRYTQDIHDAANVLPAFKRWHFLPFNTAQISKFIEKWFGDILQSSRLIKALQDHNLLSRLPNTPLVLTLLAILFSSDRHTEIPSNLSELYDMFLDLMFGKWSYNRRVETMYDAQLKQYIATEIALELHSHNSTSVTLDDYQDIVAECSARIGQPVDAEILLDDFINQSALFTIEDGALKFTHLSFQEFLVAQHIVERGHVLSAKDLLDHYDSDWWDNVLYFYSGLRKENPDLLPQLVARLSRLEDLRRIQAILELGYIVQASYLTPIEIRSQTVKSALVQYFDTIDPIKEITFDNQTFPEHLVFFGYVWLFTERYSSRFLKPMYETLLKEFEFPEEINNQQRFSIMMLAILLAHVGDSAYIDQAYKQLQFNVEQKFITALGGMSAFLLEEGTTDKTLISEENKRDLTRMVKKLKNKKKNADYKIRKI